jgi:hypothetical protein
MPTDGHENDPQEPPATPSGSTGPGGHHPSIEEQTEALLAQMHEQGITDLHDLVKKALEAKEEASETDEGNEEWTFVTEHYVCSGSIPTTSEQHYW